MPDAPDRTIRRFPEIVPMTTASIPVSRDGDARFYAAQASREQGAADGATLDNVREKHQRAADAWKVMADRASARVATRAANQQAVEAEIDLADATPVRIEA
jgi:hypothetical protein